MKRRNDPVSTVAAEWVARRDAGLTPAEENALNQWRKVDERHDQAFQSFATIWSSLGRPRRTGDSATLAHELSVLRSRRQRRRKIGAGAAAMGVLIACLAWRTLPDTRVPHTHGVSVVLRPESMTLADGSIIEYSPGSKFAVEFDPAFRRVTLTRGEAHFQVTRDESRPFSVTAGAVEVTAVGTGFAVQWSEESIEVLVTEGRVSLGPPAKAAADAAARLPLGIDAGNHVVVSRDPALPFSEPAVVPISAPAMSERLAWRSPRVEFSATPLAEVVAFINRHNRIQLVIVDDKLAATALSGIFRIGDIDALTRMLEVGFGVKAEASGDQVLLRSWR